MGCRERDCVAAGVARGSRRRERAVVGLWQRQPAARPEAGRCVRRRTEKQNNASEGRAVRQAAPRTAKTPPAPPRPTAGTPPAQHPAPNATAGAAGRARGAPEQHVTHAGAAAKPTPCVHPEPPAAPHRRPSARRRRAVSGFRRRRPVACRTKREGERRSQTPHRARWWRMGAAHLTGVPYQVLGRPVPSRGVETQWPLQSAAKGGRTVAWLHLEPQRSVHEHHVAPRARTRAAAPCVQTRARLAPRLRARRAQRRTPSARAPAQPRGAAARGRRAGRHAVRRAGARRSCTGRPWKRGPPAGNQA